MTTQRITADFILKALSERHTDELFLTEVKTGRTWAAGPGELLRLDGLAIKRSWVNPVFTGYEVKTYRSDFMRDDKWHRYLEFTHRFYFACPSGLIKPEEVPEGIGLVWCNEAGGTTVRKAAKYRRIDISRDMLYYIILSKIDSDRHPFFRDRRAYAEAYLRERKYAKDLGWKFGTALTNRTAQLETDNAVLERRAKDLETAREQLQQVFVIARAAGIPKQPWESFDEWLSILRERLVTGDRRVLEGAVRQVREAVGHLGAVLGVLETSVAQECCVEVDKP